MRIASSPEARLIWPLVGLALLAWPLAGWVLALPALGLALLLLATSITRTSGASK